MTASAQDKQLVRIDNYTITVDESGVETENFSSSSETNYYDKEGVLVMDQNANNNQRNFYTYNAEGYKASKTVYSWSDTQGWQLSESSSYTYEYDAEGNLVKMVSGSGSFTVYSGYEYGQYKKIENCSADGTPYYTSNYLNYFNEQLQVTRREMLGSDGVTPQQATTYTYNADGKLATTHMAYLDAEGKESTTNYSNEEYFYNADGTISKVRYTSNGRWGLTTTDKKYVYDNYSAAYAPQNVEAKAGPANTVTLSWDAVEGAESYVVIYDQTIETVVNNYCNTQTLLDGEHQFFVQAVFDGTPRNISDMATASVKDEGKLAAENFKVEGVEIAENEYGGRDYLVTVSFTLPEGHSDATAFKLYFGENSYDCVTVNAGDATFDGNKVTMTGTLYEYAVSDYDYDTYEYVPRTYVALWVVASYATGDADKSNADAWNFRDNVSKISTTATDNTVVEVYSLGGMKTAKAMRGVNIVKMADGRVKKVMVK